MENRQALIHEIQEELEKEKKIDYKTRYRTRLEVILSVLEDKPQDETKVSLSSIKRWIRILKEKGPKGLEDKSQSARKAFEKDLTKSPQQFGFVQEYWNGDLLAKHLAKNYGKKVSERQAQRILEFSKITHSDYSKPKNRSQKEQRVLQKKLPLLQRWIAQEAQEADIWYAGRIFISREVLLETDKIRIRKPKMRGLIFFANAITEFDEVLYRKVDLNSSFEYINAFENFFTARLTERKMVLLMNKHRWNIKLVRYINNTEELQGRIQIKYIHSELNRPLQRFKEYKLGTANSKEMEKWIKIPKS